MVKIIRGGKLVALKYFGMHAIREARAIHFRIGTLKKYISIKIAIMCFDDGGQQK